MGGIQKELIVLLVLLVSISTAQDPIYLKALSNSTQCMKFLLSQSTVNEAKFDPNDNSSLLVNPTSFSNTSIDLSECDPTAIQFWLPCQSTNSMQAAQLLFANQETCLLHWNNINFLDGWWLNECNSTMSLVTFMPICGSSEFYNEIFSYAGLKPVQSLYFYSTDAPTTFPPPKENQIQKNPTTTTTADKFVSQLISFSSNRAEKTAFQYQILFAGILNVTSCKDSLSKQDGVVSVEISPFDSNSLLFAIDYQTDSWMLFQTQECAPSGIAFNIPATDSIATFSGFNLAVDCFQSWNSVIAGYADFEVTCSSDQDFQHSRNIIPASGFASGWIAFSEPQVLLTSFVVMMD